MSDTYSRAVVVSTPSVFTATSGTLPVAKFHGSAPPDAHVRPAIAPSTFPSEFCAYAKTARFRKLVLVGSPRVGKLGGHRTSLWVV